MSAGTFDVNGLQPDLTDLPELQVPPPATPMPWLLHAYGHSVVQGGDDSWGAQFPNRFSSRLAARLRATELNFAQGASALVTDNGPNRPGAEWATSGGWVTVLQTAAPEARSRMPVLCPQQLVLVMNGHLEGGIAGPERTPGVYPGVLRTVLRRLRAGALYPDTHESVRILGPHERIEGDWRNSGDGITILTADRATVDIAIPAWYPGGLAIDVGGTYVDGAAADVIVTLDGTELGTHEVTTFATSTVGDEHPEHTPWSYRIDGALLSPGKHEIRLEYVNVKAWGSFDYWQIEASQPPLILLPETVSFPGAWDHAPVRSNFNVSEEDRLVIRDLQRAVAREFADGNVHYVPLQDVVPPDAPIFAPDDLHPNALGHDLIAERLYDYVAAHWTRAHALGTGTAIPGAAPSQRQVQIQKIRTKVGRARRKIMP
ncbi:MAG: SGNH/GDSL hydrolase family protein [Solirubrobacteraceae bacterium]|nr:SGNH/GDSL hydrolase family protein [Solirubrobacteraceae bacterium]